MITRFQALVSRESLAEVYPTTGEHNGGPFSDHGAHVVTIGENTTFRRSPIFEVVCCGERFWCLPEELNASRNLLYLIEVGTYDEQSMTWNGVNPVTHKRETLPLTY